MELKIAAVETGSGKAIACRGQELFLVTLPEGNEKITDEQMMSLVEKEKFYIILSVELRIFRSWKMVQDAIIEWCVRLPQFTQTA